MKKIIIAALMLLHCITAEAQNPLNTIKNSIDTGITNKTDPRSLSHVTLGNLMKSICDGVNSNYFKNTDSLNAALVKNAPWLRKADSNIYVTMAYFAAHGGVPWDTSATGFIYSRHQTDTAIANRAGGTMQQTATRGNVITDIPLLSNNNYKADSGIYNEILNHYYIRNGDSQKLHQVIVYALGDSWTGTGTCMSNQADAFLNRFTAMAGTKYVNMGIAGTRWTKTTTGDSSFMDRLRLIPPYTDTSYLVLVYSNNDAGAGVDSATFHASFAAGLDTCLLNKGYSAGPSHIIVTSSGVRSSAAALIKQYIIVQKAVCAAKGVQFVDIFTPAFNADTTVTSCPDMTHETSEGARRTAQVFYKGVVFPKRAVIDNYGVFYQRDSMYLYSRLFIEPQAVNSGTLRYKAPSFTSTNQYINLWSAYGSSSQSVDTVVGKLIAAGGTRLDYRIQHGEGTGASYITFWHDSTMSLDARTYFNGAGNTINQSGVNRYSMIFKQANAFSTGQWNRIGFVTDVGQSTDTLGIGGAVLSGNRLKLQFTANGVEAMAIYNNDSIVGSAPFTQLGTFYGAGRNVFGSGSNDFSETMQVYGTTLLSGTAGSSSTGPGLLHLNVTSNNSFNWSTLSLAPSLSAGNAIATLFGQATSTNNLGYFGFIYNGAGSTDNRLNFGFYGNDNLGQILATGEWLISTTTPTGSGTKLTVNGPVKMGAITGISTAALGTDISIGRHVYFTQASNPSISAGAGAGGSPTLSVGGSDQGGTITITTGSSPTVATTVATLTYNSGFTSTPRSYVLVPANDAAMSLNGPDQVYISAVSTTTATLSQRSTATTAMTASTTYKYTYTILP